MTGGGLLAHLRLRPLKTKEHLQTRPARHSEEITRRRDPSLDADALGPDDEPIPEDIAQVFGTGTATSPLGGANTSENSVNSLSPTTRNTPFFFPSPTPSSDNDEDPNDNNNNNNSSDSDVVTPTTHFSEEECWLEGPSSPDAGARAVLGALLSRSPLALCVADMELGVNGGERQPIVYANEVFFQQTGYRPKDVLGKNCRFLQGEDTDPATMDEIRRCLHEGLSFDGEVVNYSKSGKRLYNHLMLHPVRGRSGTVTHYIGIQHFSATPHPPKQQPRASVKRTSMLAPRASNVEVNVGSNDARVMAEPEDGSVIDPTSISSPPDSPPPKMTRQRADRRAGGICKVRPDHSVWLELVMRSVGPQALPVMPQAYESLKRHGRRGTIS